MGESDKVQLSAAHKAARLRLLWIRQEEAYAAALAKQAEKDMAAWTRKNGEQKWKRK